MIRKSLLIILLTIIFMQYNVPSDAAEIVDDIAIQSFAGKNLSKPIYDNKIIEDEAVKNELRSRTFSKFQIDKTVIEDTAVSKNEKLKTATKPVFKFKPIDEHAEIVRVKVSSITKIKTTKDTNIKEGQIVTFKVLKDVYKDGKIFIKNKTQVTAHIETLTPPSFGGDPSEIHIGRFATVDVNGNNIELTGEVQKQGANRAIWVRPLTDIASNISIYGTPLLLLYFVKGGKAKIDTKQEFMLCAD